MKLEQHQKEVKTLKKIEIELIKLISDSDKPILMDKFLEWQDQREVCNKGFNLFIQTEFKNNF